MIYQESSPHIKDKYKLKTSLLFQSVEDLEEAPRR